MRDPNSELLVNADPDPDHDQKLKKILVFNDKNCNLLFPCLHKSCSSYMRSLQDHKREHQALKNLKILTFFCIFVGHFDLLDPNLEPTANSDPKQCIIDT
jgi:hypothetical protein